MFDQEKERAGTSLWGEQVNTLFAKGRRENKMFLGENASHKFSKASRAVYLELAN